MHTSLTGVEALRRNRALRKVGIPIQWPRGQNYVASFPPDVYFAGVELKLFRQADGLTAIVHEELGCSLHDVLLVRSWHIHTVYAAFASRATNLRYFAPTCDLNHRLAAFEPSLGR